MTPRNACRGFTVAYCALALVACAGQPTAPARTAGDTAVAKSATADALAGYLATTELPDAVRFLRPPPAAGSAALRHDEDVALAAQALRGGASWAQAALDAEYRMPESVASFECALGVPITAARTPATLRLLSRTRQDVSVSSKDVKTTYQRPRPFMQNGQPICRPADEEFLRGNGAYPSGHAMLGWVWAQALADVVPERAQVLFERGRSYGDGRVVCNVHWHSDVQAGRELADLVIARVRASAEYRRDVDAARTEYAALTARGARPARDCAAEAAAFAAP